MLSPKAPTSPQLAQVGITLVNRSPIVLQCKRCGVEWRVIKPPRGYLPLGYWKCLNGCNTHS